MKKRKRKELGLTATVLLGTVFALTITVMTSFALALVSSFTRNPTALVGIMSLVTLLLSGAISGFVTSKANGEAQAQAVPWRGTP